MSKTRQESTKASLKPMDRPENKEDEKEEEGEGGGGGGEEEEEEKGEEEKGEEEKGEEEKGEEEYYSYTSYENKAPTVSWGPWCGIRSVRALSTPRKQKQEECRVTRSVCDQS